MFLRTTISIVFIGFGVAAPWLVQDWLSTDRNEDHASRLSLAVGNFRSRFSDDSASGGEVVKTTSDSFARPAYPVASTTVKILQGLIPSGLGGARGSGLNLAAASSIPESSRSVLIVEEARNRLDSSLQRLGLKSGDPVFLRLFKEEQELELWMKPSGRQAFVLFKVYRMTDVEGNVGPKLREGDGQAPEGFYYISPSRFIPETRHHLALDLGYPNDYDRHHGRTGGDLLIHGGRHAAGAFAVSQKGIEEVYALASAAVAEGQRYFRVNVFPFRMTDKRMDRELKKGSKWLDFWINLKEGYDFFENAHFPPDVAVSGGKYQYRLY